MALTRHQRQKKATQCFPMLSAALNGTSCHCAWSTRHVSVPTQLYFKCGISVVTQRVKRTSNNVPSKLPRLLHAPYISSQKEQSMAMYVLGVCVCVCIYVVCVCLYICKYTCKVWTLLRQPLKCPSLFQSMAPKRPSTMGSPENKVPQRVPITNILRNPPQMVGTWNVPNCPNTQTERYLPKTCTYHSSRAMALFRHTGLLII